MEEQRPLGGNVGAWPESEPRPLLRNQNFLRLWIIGLIVNLVQWLETLVVALFVYQQTHSALVVSVIAALRLAPMAFVGAISGWLSLTFGQQRVLRFVLIMTAVSLTIVAALSSSGQLSIWMLGCLTFINGIVIAFDLPLRRLMMCDVAGPRHMQQAMSIDSATNHFSRVLGPLIGGSMAATVGMGAFWFAGALYAFAVAIAFTLPSQARIAGNASRASKSGFIDLVAILRKREVTKLLILTLIYNLFAWPYVNMIPVISQSHLGLGDQATGAIVAVEGFGALAGALLMRYDPGRARHASIFIAAVAVCLIGIVVFTVATNPLLAAMTLLLAGMAVGAYSVLQATLAFSAGEPHMRERIFGVLSVCVGLSPVGVLHLGFLTEFFPPHTATMVMAFEGLLILPAAMLSWRRRSPA